MACILLNFQFVFHTSGNGLIWILLNWITNLYSILRVMPFEFSISILNSNGNVNIKLERQREYKCMIICPCPSINIHNTVPLWRGHNKCMYIHTARCRYNADLTITLQSPLQNQDFTEVALFQIMAPDDMALSESMEWINNGVRSQESFIRSQCLYMMMVSLLIHICVTRP